MLGSRALNGENGEKKFPITVFFLVDTVVEKLGFLHQK